MHRLYGSFACGISNNGGEYRLPPFQAQCLRARLHQANSFLFGNTVDRLLRITGIVQQNINFRSTR